MIDNEKRLICSIHDVGPMFASQTERLRELLHDCTGSMRMALLVVPDHWRRAPISKDRAFAAQLRAWSGEGCEIILHGWCHKDESSHSGKWAAFKARHFTAGEGEFLGLARDEAAHRMRDGRALLEDITGKRVGGFIAPAWLYGQGAIQALRELKFDFAEDHMRVWRPHDGHEMARGPVISWASRSRARTLSSMGFAALARRALRHQRVVRIALHPGDTTKPELLESIGQTIAAFRPTHRLSSYADLIKAAA
jgi:predicted deacetylase